MSTDYRDFRIPYDKMNEEYCPKCGESWCGDCPNKPYWIEYRCENPECRYAVGEDFYTGDRMIIRESDKEPRIRDLVNQIRHLYD